MSALWALWREGRAEVRVDPNSFLWPKVSLEGRDWQRLSFELPPRAVLCGHFLEEKPVYHDKSWPLFVCFFFFEKWFFFSSFFLAEPRGLRDLRSGPGIEPVPSTVKAPSPNHGTAREFTKSDFLNGDFMWKNIDSLYKLCHFSLQFYTNSTPVVLNPF